VPGFVFWSLMMPGFRWCLGVVAPKLLRPSSAVQGGSRRRRPLTTAGAALTGSMSGRKRLPRSTSTAHTLMHPLHHPSAHAGTRLWVSGTGAVITDSTGRDYIDGLSGLWNVNVGHGREELADAARQQMATPAYHSSYAGSTRRTRSRGRDGALRC
jgi:hypothetical protein